MPKTFRKTKTCLNCNFEVGEFNYCPDCGQINSDRHIPLRELLKDAFSELFTIDSKFFKSFVPLVKKPGHLTNEYNMGKRVSYVFPLRLYIFTTLMFFFMLSLHSKLTSTNDSSTFKEKTLSELTTYLNNEFALISDTAVTKELTHDLHDRYYIVNRPHDADDISKTQLVKIIQQKLPAFSKELHTRLGNAIAGKYSFELDESPRNNPNINSIVFSLVDSISAQPLLDTLYTFDIDKDRRGGGPNIVVNGTPADSLNEGFVKYITDKGSKLSEDKLTGKQRFLTEFINVIPKIMFLFLPLFALLLKLLYIRRKILYINHLIFSFHIHTLWFMYILFPIVWTHWSVIMFTLLGSLTHLYFSMKAVYKQNILKTVSKLVLLIGAYGMLLLGGAFIAVVLALMST